ncbi:MAG: hypothetical protein M5T61_00920 [Acidimicrobiia bacterium]|nr:hypothetical protein [Acidimicrobiia bacterium]
MNLDNQTTMYDTYMGNCSQNTDAIWVRETNPAYYGSYTCEDFNQNGTCEKGIVRLNFDTLSRDDGGSIDLWKSVACQELGHSVGLTHASNDCMGNLSLLEYSPHHVNHVNNDRWP